MSDAVNKPAHYNQGSIECIEAMKIVLTPEEFRGYLKGNVFKYLWREKDKNGIEDIRKGKSYFDRLIDLADESEQQKASELQSLKDHPFGKLREPVVKQSLTTEPPDGWRFLERGEVIRKGDKYRDLKSQTWIECVGAVGDSLQDFHKPTIRRNRFEVGEKVVHVSNDIVYKVIRIHSVGYQLESEFCEEVVLHGKSIAPYIEETK